MKSMTRNWIIIACVLIACGLGFGLAGLIAVGFDFDKLNNVGKSIENTYPVSDRFDGISIDVSTADISFEESKENKVEVYCKENEKLKHSVKVEGGVLKIQVVDERKWYEYISFGFGSSFDSKIIIYLPKEMKESLKTMQIETSTGDINLSDFMVSGMLKLETSTGNMNISKVKAGAIEIETSTGEMNLSDLSAESLKLDSSTGDLLMTGSRFSKDLRIETSTGDVKLSDCDADTVNIDTSTGDIDCTFLSEKKIKADSNTGKIKVPDNNGNGGECRLVTSTGDITVAYAK